MLTTSAWLKNSSLCSLHNYYILASERHKAIWKRTLKMGSGMWMAKNFILEMVAPSHQKVFNITHNFCNALQNSKDTLKIK